MRRARIRIAKFRGPLAIIGVFVLAAVVALIFGQPGGPPTSGLIASVVDGDTLDVQAHGTLYKVRLIGVDTPEAHPSDRLDREARRTRQDKTLIMALGRRASEFTRQLCEGKTCRLEYDRANAARGHRDTFNRLLAYVWVTAEGGNEVLVNAKIIRRGFGRAMTRYPYDETLKADFLRLQREARAEGRGLWGEWKP